MSDQARIQEAYQHLLRAEAEHQAITPLTELYPDLTVDEAYQVQLLTISQRVKDGQPIIGKKIGLTSVPMQQMFGVDQPDYGHLLSSMQIQNKGIIRADRLFQPKVEAEIAFVLKKDLHGPNVTLEDVLHATDYVVAALEIVDSRIKDWKIKLQDTIADNASSGLFVLGDERFSAADIDLTKEEMKLYRNGEYVNTGSGSAVLGHPATCAAWLANKLYEYNVNLKAGEVILSGALSAAVNAYQGDRVTAEFINLGKVEVAFT